jgi:uncharacterized membrane protein
MDHGHRNAPVWYDAARHTHEHWWYGPLHVVALIVLLGLLVVGAVWVARRLSSAAPASTAGVGLAASQAVDPAVATLRMRYAQGEVARDDFLHALHDLTGAPMAPTSGADENTEPIES